MGIGMCGFLHLKWGIPIKEGYCTKAEMSTPRPTIALWREF
jgi:hypothetical protein